eukprot:1710358-Alexandrium_andersonii.AAC.1
MAQLRTQMHIEAVRQEQELSKHSPFSMESSKWEASDLSRLQLLWDTGGFTDAVAQQRRADAAAAPPPFLWMNFSATTKWRC